MGMSWTTLIVMGQSAVGWAERGAVTGTLQFFQSIGGTLWVSLQGAVLGASVAAGLRAAGVAAEPGMQSFGRGMGALNAMLDPGARAALPPEHTRLLAAVLADGLQQVFVLYLVAALVGLVAVALLPATPAPAQSEAPS
jgi:hypothetical protein